MSGSHPESMRKEVKVYWKVFSALTAGTIITVAIAKLHFGVVLAIIAALVVAFIKGSLVAAYFMHLLSERKLVYFVLSLTAVFFVALLALVLLTNADQQGVDKGVFQVPQRHVQPHYVEEHGEDNHVP